LLPGSFYTEEIIMRLTIIQPCMGRKTGESYIRTWQMEPLAPAVLAALTPKEVQVNFFDDRMEEIRYEEPTDLVAITIETYTARRAYQIASEYRKRGVPVVMGGFHATLLPDEVAQYAECVVVGQAEETWPQLIRDFQNGCLQKEYKADRHPEIGGQKPDRSIFSGKKYLPVSLVETGRGCRYKCEFCSIQTAFQQEYISRPVDEVIEEISGLHNNIIFFVDDNIVADLSRAKALLKALVPLQIKWIGQADISVATDDELLELLVKSGCQGLLIGLESLDSRSLVQMGKGFAVGKNYYEKTLAKLRKYGIRIYATFVMGYDEDSISTVHEVLAFAKEQRFYLAAFNHITPFPGTPLFNRLLNEGRLTHKNWWMDETYQYGMLPFKPQKIDALQLEEECINARQKFFSVKSILRRSMDFHVNSRTLFMWAKFFIINGLMRKEVMQRRRYPLGDESYVGPILKASAGQVSDENDRPLGLKCA
jgi:radical SAM superfamily enzyme YgiQ (UPF0313 family)